MSPGRNLNWGPTALGNSQSNLSILFSFFFISIKRRYKVTGISHPESRESSCKQTPTQSHIIFWKLQPSMHWGYLGRVAGFPTTPNPVYYSIWWGLKRLHKKWSYKLNGTLGRQHCRGSRRDGALHDGNVAPASSAHLILKTNISSAQMVTVHMSHSRLWHQGLHYHAHSFLRMSSCPG